MKDTIYKCDKCGKTIESIQDQADVKLPRHCRHYATNDMGVTLMAIDKLEIMEGELCIACADLLAYALPIIGEAKS